MENTTNPAAVEPTSAEPVEPQQVQLPQIQPPPPLPRSEPVLDPTDLSDTTESEAEKHGSEYFFFFFCARFVNISLIFLIAIKKILE